MRSLSLFFLSCLLIWCALANVSHASELIQINNIQSWKDLTPSPLFKQRDGVALYQFKTGNGAAANLIVVDLNAKDLAVKPFFNATTGTTSDAAKRLNAIAAINGGYFNLSNGESTSYVVIDQKNQCDPTTNKSLISNPKLQAFLPEIFRRSEIRLLTNSNGKYKAMIASHEAPIPKGWMLKHSLQAGPRLLPNLNAQDEAFIRTDPDGKEVDSIGSSRTAARTAVGITTDNHLLFICVAGKKQNEFSAGISLPDLANLLKHLGCSAALNLDGGTSTTMVVNKDSLVSDTIPNSQLQYKQLCGITPEKLIKSGLAIVIKQ